MNHCVPDFGIDEDDPFFSAIGFPNRKILPDSGNELAEIVWQKGPVLRRLGSDSLPYHPDDASGAAAGAGIPAPVETDAVGDLFMGENEMASWLHCSNDDLGGASSIQWTDLYRRPVTPPLPETPGRALQQPGRQRSALPILPAMGPPEGMSRVGASRDSTVVGSNMTPGMMSTAHLPPDSRMWTMAATTDGPGTFEETTAAFSSGCVGSGSGSGERTAHVADDRKRKAREFDDSDGEEAEYDPDDKKKDARRPARRTRAAEVHNLSERRRRDRINEKMKALQQLIPRCNKSDKASMLDDAVEYLKSLQLQIQMMSMGCTMPSMVFPGIPQYAPPMGMAMGMGMDTKAGCVAQSMLPFSPVLKGSPFQGPIAAHLGARMPMQAFHPTSMVVHRHLRGQTPGQQDPAANSMCLQGQNPMQVLNILDHYRQLYSLQQILQQMQPPHQNQAVLEQDACKGHSLSERPDSSKPKSF